MGTDFYSDSLLALYEYLRRDDRVEKSSFVGLILTLWGTALALPSLGIVSFVASIARQQGSADQARIGQIVTEAVIETKFAIGIVAAIFYTMGPLSFGLAIWRKGNMSRISAVLFAIHGVLLSFGVSIFPALILGWVLLAISGILISLDVRKEVRTENDSGLTIRRSGPF